MRGPNDAGRLIPLLHDCRRLIPVSISFTQPPADVTGLEAFVRIVQRKNARTAAHDID
jgi:hypothetical protein